MNNKRKPYNRIDPAIRFWAKVEKQENGCWLWKGAIMKGGYAVFGLGGSKNILAHRYMYIQEKGEIPEGHAVTHTCSRKDCVNPDHLIAVPEGQVTGGERIDPSIRFWAKVNKVEGGCWLWQGSTAKTGYGTFNINRNGIKTVPAHRYAYQITKGEIPEGYHLDHLCRVHNCVNPDHLEPVPPGENIRRGMSPSMVVHRTGVCQKGHPMTPDNIYKGGSSNRQECKTCRNASRREWIKRNPDYYKSDEYKERWRGYIKKYRNKKRGQG